MVIHSRILAWWATVHSVAQSRTRLKWLSMHLNIKLNQESNSLYVPPQNQNHLYSDIQTKITHWKMLFTVCSLATYFIQRSGHLRMFIRNYRRLNTSSLGSQARLLQAVLLITTPPAGVSIGPTQTADRPGTEAQLCHLLGDRAPNDSCPVSKA